MRKKQDGGKWPGTFQNGIVDVPMCLCVFKRADVCMSHVCLLVNVCSYMPTYICRMYVYYYMCEHICPCMYVCMSYMGLCVHSIGICVSICIHACMSAFISAYMSMGICVSIYVHVCMSECMSMCLCVSIYDHVCMSANMSLYTYVCLCMYHNVRS